jgi:hypothetical protein
VQILVLLSVNYIFIVHDTDIDELLELFLLLASALLVSRGLLKMCCTVPNTDL